MINPHNQDILQRLPQKYLNVFTEFAALSEIPRGSGYHGPVEKYLTVWAIQHQFKVAQDAHYNILITIPPTPGLESRPSVCLQAHTDMVWSSDVKHEFKKDPILWRISDGNLMAIHTSLGADDGIGVALALALAADITCCHGPLELLFTSDEEIGYIGAKNLKVPVVSKFLINLDQEDFDEFTLSFQTTTSANTLRHFTMIDIPQDYGRYEIQIGTHYSGHDIEESENLNKNAMLQLLMLLQVIYTNNKFNLCKIVSNFNNRIPSIASAVIAINLSQNDLETQIIAAEKQVKQALQLNKNQKHTVTDIPETSKCLNTEDTQSVIDILQIVNTPFVPSEIFEGEAHAVTVPTTTQLIEGKFLLHTTSFSFLPPEHKQIADRIERLRTSTVWETCSITKTDGWEINMESPLFKTLHKIYSRLCPELIFTANHDEPDMEADIFHTIYEGIDAITVGPKVDEVHSVREYLEIDTVGRMYEVLKEFLAEFRLPQ